MSNRKVFKVGESVLHRPNFGRGAPTVGMIKSMELTERPRMKDGEQVQEATLEQVNENRVVFVLDNGWIYSEQVVNVDRI